MKRIDVYALSRFLILVALLNEKDSVEKVRQSVVRIVGGAGEGS